jgi:hypothetical protein
MKADNSDMKPARIFSIGVVLSLLASVLFFSLWYLRYLGIEFNELGRYYDAEAQIVYTDSAFVWCLPAFGFLLPAVLKITFRLWRRRKAARPPAPH